VLSDGGLSTVNRRRFAFTAAALAAFGFGFATDRARRVRSPTLEAQLRRLFSRPGHAAEVGHRYLAVYPAKASREALLADLGETHAACSTRACTPQHRFARWLERDFHAGAVVQLDGWILARAEVSLCALVYLDQQT
jgi:hypothetical protein